MTQVSLFGDIPNDIQLDDNTSDIYSDDGNQQDEIRKALEEEFNASLDFSADDSDESSENESRCSSVNLNNNNKEKTSFLSEKDTSHVSVNGNGSMLGSIKGNRSHAMNGNNVMSNGVNLNMLPNSIMEISQNMIYPMSMSGRVDTNPSLTSTPIINGHANKVNGKLVNGNGSGGGTALQQTPSFPRQKKQVTIVENVQKNREDEEIEAANPTLSLLHQQHCPRYDNGSHVDSDMWLASENKDEQTKTMLELRERQIRRVEEEVQKLQKDKRSLNHQIGLMKTEMVNMRSQQEEVEKVTRLKEQECDFLRLKLQETINEYEKVKIGENTARDEIVHLNHEIEKLRQEIVLLSNIGHSTQQAEISDVVRQLREKHDMEYLSWKKVVATLEGELKNYKRKLQLQKEESFTGEANVGCQTDEVKIVSPFKSPQSKDHQNHAETEIAILKNDGDGDLLIKERKIISMSQKFEELKTSFEEEKAQLISSFQNEISYYRQKLQTLPEELYRLWESTQRELGLQAQLDNRPICVDAFTSPMTPEEMRDHAGFGSGGFNSQGAQTSNNSSLNKSDLHDAEVQVNFASLMANKENKHESCHNANSSNEMPSQLSEKETSHVEIQTEETLETYRILGQLLASWSQEVHNAKANQAETATRCEEYEKALKKLQKQFKILQKIASKCRKETKIRDEVHKKQIEEMKDRHVEVLQSLQEKLDILS